MTPAHRVRQWGYGGVVALLVAWGLWARFRLPLTPFADLDTWHFLNPALSCLAGKGFYHTEGGTFVYPAFLLGVLGWAPDLRAVTVVQHFLGVGGAGLLLLAWRRLRMLAGVALVPGWAWDAGGVVILGCALLGENRVGFEHMLRPEAVTGFFTALNFALTLEFIRRRFYERAPVASAVAGGWLLVNSGLLFLLKPAYFATAMLAVAPVVVSLADRRERWQDKAWLVGPALGVVLAMFTVEHALANSDTSGREFLARTLFVIHAPIIADQMQADLSRPGVSTTDRAALDAVHARLVTDIAQAHGRRGGWETLGFNPDRLMYGGDAFCAHVAEEIPDQEKRRAFYVGWYRRACVGQPVRMARKIGRELGEFYASGNAFGDTGWRLTLGQLYKTSRKAFQYHPDEIGFLPMGQRYLESCTALGKKANGGTITQPVVVSWIVTLLAYAYLPVLLGSLAVAGGCIFRREWRGRFGLLAALAVLFYGYNFGNCLATAVVHSLSVRRYITAQFTATLFSEGVGLMLLAEVAMGLLPFFRRWQRGP